MMTLRRVGNCVFGRIRIVSKTENQFKKSKFNGRRRHVSRKCDRPVERVKEKDINQKSPEIHERTQRALCVYVRGTRWFFNDLN